MDRRPILKSLAGDIPDDNINNFALNHKARYETHTSWNSLYGCVFSGSPTLANGRIIAEVHMPLRQTYLALNEQHRLFF